MTLAEVREHLHVTPFRPLTLRLAGGRAHRVEHPDYLFVPPVGDLVMVVNQGGGFHLLDIGQIEEIEVDKARQPAAS